ncbi:MAG: hypothetical protein ABL949_07185 [Fimbriimonadaceae bacterium]
MSKISCAGEEFDPDEAEVFCHVQGHALYIQVVILFVVANALVIAFWFKLIGASPLGFIVVLALLNVYLHFRLREDIAKGFYFAGFERIIYVRSPNGESVVKVSEVKYITFGKYGSIVRENQASVPLPGLGKDNEAMESWLKNKFRARS